MIPGFAFEIWPKYIRISFLLSEWILKIITIKKKQNREIKKHTQSQYFLKYVEAKLNEYFESKKTSSEMKHKKVKEIYQKNKTNNENMEEADTKICLNKTKKN